MDNSTMSGEVSDAIKEEILIIQEEVHPSIIGSTREERIANIEKHTLPQFKANLFGKITNLDDWLEATRAGTYDRHTSVKHDLVWFSCEDTVVCYGLADGADYDEDGNKSNEYLNFPFCDVFVRVDGRMRGLAVSASAVMAEPTD